MAALYLLGTLLMIALPLALASALAHWREASWGLFGIGAATFVGSQLLHIPFNALVEDSGVLPADLSPLGNLLIVSLFLGLSAGVFEEVARYLAYRFWARDARQWRAGLMLATGHGGIEAVLLGLVGLVNVVAIFGVGQGYFDSLVAPEQMPLVQAQLQALRSAAWFDALLAPAERAFALTAHLALSLLVLQSIVRGQLRWLALAIAWHALLDTVAVFAAVRWNVYVAEGGIAVIAFLSLVIIFSLRRPSPEPPERPSKTVSTEEPRVLEKGEFTAEQLEQSRYQ